MSPMADFLDILNDTKVTVKVGVEDAANTYFVSKALLCKVAWFAAAFEGDRFLEATTGFATLPEDHPQAFEALLYHLHRGELEFPAIGSAMTDDQLSSELETCLYVWVFGDKYGVPAMQNAVILRACELMTHRSSRYADVDKQFDNRKLDISFTTVELYHGLTAEGSPLRKLMADYVVFQVKNKQAPYGRFETLETYSGFIEDYASARAAYESDQRNERGANFPRYLQPYKHYELYCVEDNVSSEEGSDLEEGTASTRYGCGNGQSRKAWSQADDRCIECTTDQSAWGVCTHCGESQPDKCMSCRQRCFLQLCGDCKTTYEKSSVQEEADNRAFIDSMLRARPELGAAFLSNQLISPGFWTR
ncbi:hypothetical protein LTS10_009340 [Elasticomyces elasticus]|nr:hypothetical protein LTS10_009340 [Elasticomyces elasticus]